MKVKKYLYAAVGAQVAVAKSAQSKLEELMSRVNDNASSTSADVKSRIEVWADEGEQFLSQVGDTKAIDELTSKVDFDQVQTQVNKLRDQLEDIVSTWRANFRPESKPVEKVVVTDSEPSAKPEASAAKPAAKATATKATATKATATKATATKAAATKATTSKAPAAKPAAKKPAAKKPAAKKPTAKKPTAATASKDENADQKAS